MKHEIDLANYNLYTDLIVDDPKHKVKYQKEEIDNINVTYVCVDEENQKLLKKKIGNYITIEFNDITDITNQNNVEKVLIKYLEKIMKKIDKQKGLIIGLGNSDSTPDSLGPRVIKDIIVTNHITKFAKLDKGFNNVSAFTPGVIGETGIEASDLILNLIKIINPTYIIVIDSLTSLSVKRVNKTIQICDTGITPGSGVGNNRTEISYDTLGIPVIAIGVPTVVDAITIVADTINYMYENNKYLFNKNFNEKEMRELLNSIFKKNLMVTPKEIDFTIKKLSNILSNGINKVIHPKLKIK